MNQRLPKSLRIRRGKEIQEVLFNGQKYTGTHVILYCAASPDLSTPVKVGFLSPRKIGGAVGRNRVRRWMREAFRRHREEFKGSNHILIMGRHSAVKASYQQVHDEFLRLCRKAHLLIAPPSLP